ncbi:MAG: hypothetical protein CMH54_12665 [Myxococcales bacterium]|nr:hypothetical protein [Myxococcales bacterium]
MLYKRGELGDCPLRTHSRRFGHSGICALALLVSFLISGCSGGGTTDDVGADLGDTLTDVGGDVGTDQNSGTDGDSDVGVDSSDTGGGDTNTTIVYEWAPIPVGAAGDLHRVRYLPAVGFRIVGHGGTILRPVGDGWVREWTPNTAQAIRDIEVHQGNMHAVGEYGTWLSQDGNGMWQSQDPGVDIHLRGLTSVSDALVAVGNSGVIVKNRGATFSQEPSGVFNALHSVEAVAESTAYAVGDSGVAVKRVASPRTCDEGPDDLCTPCLVSTDCTYDRCETMPGGEETKCTQACGEGLDACPESFICTNPEEEGFCIPEPDHNWIGFQAASATVTLRDLLVLDSNNIWAVGTDGTIARYGSGQWQLELSNDSQKRDVYAVGGGSGEILAVGDAGLFVKHDSNGVWSLLDDVEGPLLTTRRYEGLATGPDRVVAAGEGGALQIKLIPDEVFRDGLAEPPGNLHDISFAGDMGTAVGDEGVFVFWNADGYGSIDVGTTEHLYGTVVGEDGAAYAVGASGTLIQRNADGQIHALETGTLSDLHAALILDDGTLLAVGANGTVLHRDPESGTVSFEPTPDPRDLLDVFEDGSGILAIGRGGVILRRQGDNWVTVPSTTTLDLYAGSYALGRTTVVGAHGIVLSWTDEQSPSKVAESPGDFYYGVWARTNGDILIVGWSGVFLRLRPDMSLAPAEGPTSNTLRAVGESNGILVVAGDGGKMWERSEASVPLGE